VVSRVRVVTRDDAAVSIRSLDMGKEQHASSLNELTLGGDLDLAARLLRFYRPETGVDVELENQAPKGSGLGASSALLIALSGALNALQGWPHDPESIIAFGADLEAQNIRIPTGKQDYYAATHGGVNAIWFNVRRNRVEPLLVNDAAIRTLEERLILSFTNIHHFSAVSNWSMLRNYIEGLGNTRQAMAGIKRTALAMREALLANDFDEFPRVLDEEWQNRRGLAADVTNPQIDAMMAAASGAGALASKICGAGGGGCMISFVREGTQEAVIAALEAQGARHIRYRISRAGLEVRTS
jgi:D-glycero-alpha-D-manno-heptose-7-phosphate kinase